MAIIFIFIKIYHMTIKKQTSDGVKEVIRSDERTENYHLILQLPSGLWSFAQLS